jgi:CheY-like chemotaxis protein
MAANQLAVLVADDDDATRAAIAELLARHGIEASIAADGQAALERLTQGEPPCMILLDWVMPRMDGEAFLAARAASDRLSTIPVVVMSATHAPVADRRINAFLPKPVVVSELVSVLRATCRAACPAWLREQRGCALGCPGPS